MQVSGTSGLVVGFHFMVTQERGTTWRSPSLSRSSTWPLSSSWNPSAHLALVLELLGHPPSDAVLTPAISPITGRLVEGWRVLFLPVQVQRTCPEVLGTRLPFTSLAKTSLQGTVKGGRRQGRQKRGGRTPGNGQA